MFDFDILYQVKKSPHIFDIMKASNDSFISLYKTAVLSSTNTESQGCAFGNAQATYISKCNIFQCHANG